MRQKLTEHTTEAELGHAMIDMGHDESVLILIKHCQDMKQQETRLRFITLLLLLGCTTVFIFTICVDLWQHENSGSSGEGTAVAPSPIFSKQETARESTDNLQTNSSQKLRIDLVSDFDSNMTGGRYMKWSAVFGEKHSQPHAIVIPEDGYYFVYVRIFLGCFEDGEDFKALHVQLHKWNKGYPKNVNLTEAQDGLTCIRGAVRNVFLGQLFHLSKGDHVKVWIGEGYELIQKAAFGAYLT